MALKELPLLGKQKDLETSVEAASSLPVQPIPEKMPAVRSWEVPREKKRIVVRVRERAGIIAGFCLVWRWFDGEVWLGGETEILLIVFLEELACWWWFELAAAGSIYIHSSLPVLRIYCRLVFYLGADPTFSHLRIVEEVPMVAQGCTVGMEPASDVTPTVSVAWTIQ